MPRDTPNHADLASRRRLLLRWAAGFAFGLAIELAAMVAMDHFHAKSLEWLRNWPFDGMMRLTAGADTAPSLAPNDGLTLVRIDDLTWRSAGWGGGEPALAPRKQLLTLVRKAFDHGATIVVLDVLVEGAGGIQGDSAAGWIDNETLAKDLQQVVMGSTDESRQLIVVRSVRAPLDERADYSPSDAMGELRTSTAVDQAMKGARGRIAVAAPYFVLDADRVLRSWNLFQVLCRPTSDGRTVAIVPSVQLLVLEHKHHITPVDQDVLAQQAVNDVLGSGADCPATDNAERAATIRRDVSERFWHLLHDRACQGLETAAGPCKFPEAWSPQRELGSRVIYRYRESINDSHVRGLRALDLLDEVSLPPSFLDEQLRGRVVVIAQTFAEAGDRHLTPLGEMSGGWVLVNAIDSLGRFAIIEEPGHGVRLLIAALSCAAIAWLFVRWHSLAAAVLASVGLIVTFLLVSYFWFHHNVWFDFAIPSVGVLAHRFLERRHSSRYAVSNS